MFERYSKYSKVDVAKAIDLEMKGDIESCLTAVVKCAGSRPAFFAEKLYLAMKVAYIYSVQILFKHSYRFS